MSAPPKSARSVTCPSCGKPTLFAPANPSRPFCSERCRLTDLGGWASEAYRVPVKPAEDEPELEPPGSDPNSSAQ